MSQLRPGFVAWIFPARQARMTVIGSVRMIAATSSAVNSGLDTLGLPDAGLVRHGQRQPRRFSSVRCCFLHVLCTVKVARRGRRCATWGHERAITFCGVVRLHVCEPRMHTTLSAGAGTDG